MWTLIELPQGWGDAWVDTLPLVSDEQLRRIPDFGTRKLIRDAVIDAILGADETLAPLRRLQAICTERMKDMSSRAYITGMPTQEFKDLTAGWANIDSLCGIAIEERVKQMRGAVDETMVARLLERWLQLRLETMETLQGRHEVSGYTVKDGIVQPRIRP